MFLQHMWPWKKVEVIVKNKFLYFFFIALVKSNNW